jgi:hypothetical protein
MQRRSLAYSLLFAILAFGCHGPQDPKDLPFRSGTLGLRADGSRERALLATPALLDGYPCDGWVMWHDNGVLTSFDLSSTATAGSRTRGCRATRKSAPTHVAAA